jgi:Ca-activated chloride channel family protein
MFLNSIDTKMVPTQGTAIGQAIKIAMNSFSPESTAEQAIIVITDGENHEDDATEAARMAAEKGVKVSVVGIGSSKGAPIPISGSSNNFMKDAEGKTVITKLNEAMAQEVAQAGEGIYVRADNTNGALQALINEVRTMKSAEFERKTYSEYNEQFPGLAWIALVLLLVDAFLLERKYGWISSIHIFNKKK